jgi:hypothetical protein
MKSEGETCCDPGLRTHRKANIFSSGALDVVRNHVSRTFEELAELALQDERFTHTLITPVITAASFIFEEQTCSAAANMSGHRHSSHYAWNALWQGLSGRHRLNQTNGWLSCQFR